MNIQVSIDGRQSEKALAVQRGVGRLMRAHAFTVLNEFTLVTGRRADVIAVGNEGSIFIIEIKSSIEDFRCDRKWHEYQDFCDQFFFAIPQCLPPEIIPDHTGLIIADSWGAEIMRDAPRIPLHASRRKAVTLSIARAASQRLHDLYDP